MKNGNLMNIIKSIRQLIPAMTVVFAVILAVTNFPPVPEILQVQAETKAEPKVEEEEEVKELPAMTFEGTYYGTGIGYAGKIEVEVVVAGSKISQINIINIEADDAEFMARARSVIDFIIESQNLDVDVVSGATYSSRGIIEAVKNALTGEVSESEIADTAQQPATSKEITFEEIAADGYQDGIYYGTGIGFAGKLTVKVVIENSIISDIELVEIEADDAEYISMAKGVIDRMLGAQDTNVDVVSGATYSSKGIITAVRAALKQAENTKTEDTAEEEPATEKKAPPVNAQPSAKWKDGTYTGKAKVIPPKEEKTWFEYELKMDVTIENEKVTNITNITHDSTGALGILNTQFTNRAVKEMLPYLVASQGEDGVDIVSGATCSAEALKRALKDALLQAEKAANQEGSSLGNNESNETGEGTDPKDTGEPETPVEGGNQGEVENPQQPENPGEPETPQKPENPGEPQNPTQPGESDGGELIDGTYIGEAPVEITAEDIGWDGYQLYVTLTVENGKVKEINKITIDSTGPMAMLNQTFTDNASRILIPMLRHKETTEGIDVVSSATRSSVAILRAYEQAVQKAKKVKVDSTIEQPHSSIKMLKIPPMSQLELRKIRRELSD